VEIKQPGDQLISRPVELDYDYDQQRDGPLEEAYARLLEDALEGEQRLFARADGVQQAWRVVQPILDDPPPVLEYEPGTWGPPQADELIADHGGWHRPKVVSQQG
jgi:glucose-6-phosphate 1-dehydrogenase